METYIAALDQGTTTSRAILFNSRGEIVSKAQYPFRQIFPQPGWVEHDPMEIWATTVRALSEAVDAAHIDPKAIAGVGITNQRETAILWDRRTGQPVYNAIVWQCRRTAEICDRLKADGLGETVTEKTGLLIDAYFSGTKLKWIMDNIPGVRQRAERGELLFGTVFWDYSKFKFNLGGRINLLYCFFWGIAAVMWMRYGYPLVLKLMKKVRSHIRPWMTAALAVFMAVNMLTSALALARYDARTSGEAPNGQLEVFLDEHFDNARMEHIYPNAKKVTKAE